MYRFFGPQVGFAVEGLGCRASGIPHILSFLDVRGWQGQGALESLSLISV